MAVTKIFSRLSLIAGKTILFETQPAHDRFIQLNETNHISPLLFLFVNINKNYYLFVL